MATGRQTQTNAPALRRDVEKREATDDRRAGALCRVIPAQQARELSPIVGAPAPDRDPARLLQADAIRPGGDNDVGAALERMLSALAAPPEIERHHPNGVGAHGALTNGSPRSS
jgi:hypothetical protein